MPFKVASGIGVQVLLAYPESLATLPFSFDLPDAGTLAAAAMGRGMVALGGDGTTAFLDRFTFDLEFAAALSDPPAADDGTLVSDSAGNVVRVAWNERLVAHRFDVVEDAWLELGNAEGARPGATFIPFGDDAVLLLGGNDRTDALVIQWSPEEDGAATFDTGPAWAALDAPRIGAAALGLPFPDGPRPLVVGGDDPSVPRVLAAWGGAAAVGPPKHGRACNACSSTPPARMRPRTSSCAREASELTYRHPTGCSSRWTPPARPKSRSSPRSSPPRWPTSCGCRMRLRSTRKGTVAGSASTAATSRLQSLPQPLRALAVAVRCRSTPASRSSSVASTKRVRRATRGKYSRPRCLEARGRSRL